MKKALLPVLVFVVMQALVGIIAAPFLMILNANVQSAVGATVLGITVILSGLATFLICWKGLKMIEFPETFDFSVINWKWAAVAIVASILGMAAANFLSEIINLPNTIEDLVLSLSHNFWGVLAVAVVGPIIEELIFREGICGYLIRNGANVWKSIWISSILFAVIHFNPAQIAFALPMGIILGIIYAKTGNIVVCSIIHILNNSISIIQVWALGDNVLEFSGVEWVGGIYAAGACIIVGTAGCAYLLRKFWESKEVTIVQEVTEDYETRDNYQR